MILEGTFKPIHMLIHIECQFSFANLPNCLILDSEMEPENLEETYSKT